MVTTGLCVIAGEITTKATVDMQEVVREVVRDVGYTEADMGISADHCCGAGRASTNNRPTSRWA